MPDEDPKQKIQQPRYYNRGRVLRRLMLLFGLHLGLCGAIAWLSVSPKRSELTSTPMSYGMQFENVAFYSSDGTKLAGWYIPAKSNPKGVIVFCHGVDGNRTAMLTPARMLHKHGYAALLFDFRARGESAGSHSTLGWKETDDLLAAIDVARTRPDLQGVPIAVLGHSMGGAVALMGAARSLNVRAVVAESPYVRLDHAVHNHFRDIFGRLAPLFEIPTRWFGERLIGRNSANIAPIRGMSKISPRAVFLIQDADDTLCPPSETQALLAACSEPKDLWTVPHAGHVQAAYLRPEEFENRVSGFFDTYLKR